MERRFRATAWALSLAGIIPFIIPIFWLYFAADDQQLVERAHLYLITYGAIILSFLGGLRWGAALTEGTRANLLLLSVVPSLLAWGCLLMPMPFQLPILTSAIVCQWLWDLYASRNGTIAPWFGNLRTAISLCVISLFALAMIAMQFN